MHYMYIHTGYRVHGNSKDDAGGRSIKYGRKEQRGHENKVSNKAYNYTTKDQTIMLTEGLDSLYHRLNYVN